MATMQNITSLVSSGKSISTAVEGFGELPAAVKSPVAPITSAAVIATQATPSIPITPTVLKGGGGAVAKYFGGLASDEAFLTTPFTPTAHKSPFTGVGAHAVHPFSRDFNTQSNAADYIADHMVGSFNGPAVDKKVHDAVLRACNEWRPGQDLSRLVYDEVLKALTGVLPSDGSKSSGVPGGADGIPISEIFGHVPVPDGTDTTNPLAPHANGFDVPVTAEAVARLMAAQIRANGFGVDDVAEHMYLTPDAVIR